VEGTPRPETT